MVAIPNTAVPFPLGGRHQEDGALCTVWERMDTDPCWGLYLCCGTSQDTQVPQMEGNLNTTESFVNFVGSTYKIGIKNIEGSLWF